MSGTEDPTVDISALDVLRRGLRSSPELRRGGGVTVALAVMSGAGRVAVPVLVQQVLDRGIVDGRVHLGTVGTLASLAVLALGITAVASRITQRRLAVASEEALSGLRTRAFAHIHRLSVAHHAGERRGVLVSRVTSDVETLSQFFEWGGVAWLVNGAVMIATAVTMFVYDWRMATVAVVVVLPLAVVLRLVQRRLVLAWDLVRTRVGEVAAAVSETVQGAAVVRGYGVEERTTGRVVEAIGRSRDAHIRAGTLGAFLFPSGELFAALTVAAVLVTGVVIGPDGGLSTGEVVAFLFLVNLFLEPVAELTEILDITQTAVAGWRKVLDVLDTPVDVVAPDVGVALPDRAPEIVIEGVSFAYGDGMPLVLDDVSARIRPATRVALVGATGSGKTTLALLLTRLADPTAGKVLIDGVDLRHVAPASLRERLGLVPQDGFLFGGTIADNVRFASPAATDLQVQRAFVELGLASWLDGLPQGLDTRVGQRGEHLSVGERQLVSLARAYVADPTCLVLDEATSAVDPATDMRLQHALQLLSEGRTFITIAHRLATAEHADQVLVLDRGRLVESGRHDALLAADGVYARLHASWLDVTAVA